MVLTVHLLAPQHLVISRCKVWAKGHGITLWQEDEWEGQEGCGIC